MATAKCGLQTLTSPPLVGVNDEVPRRGFGAECSLQVKYSISSTSFSPLPAFTNTKPHEGRQFTTFPVPDPPKHNQRQRVPRRFLRRRQRTNLRAQRRAGSDLDTRDPVLRRRWIPRNGGVSTTFAGPGAPQHWPEASQRQLGAQLGRKLVAGPRCRAAAACRAKRVCGNIARTCREQQTKNKNKNEPLRYENNVDAAVSNTHHPTHLKNATLKPRKKRASNRVCRLSFVRSTGSVNPASGG